MGWYHVPRPIVPDLIVQHGRNQARKPALLCGERRWSWAEFDAATNQVANGLLQLGLAPGARLAVLMQNSAEMALLLFGAGKAGVSVVPLNTSVSDAAVAAMMRDSGATAVAASGAVSLKDMGKVMALLKPQVQGRADVGAVSALVKQRLGP